jgi:peptidoglycan hydrolase CwlO-like protein
MFTVGQTVILTRAAEPHVRGQYGTVQKVITSSVVRVRLRTGPNKGETYDANPFNLDLAPKMDVADAYDSLEKSYNAVKQELNALKPELQATRERLVRINNLADAYESLEERYNAVKEELNALKPELQAARERIESLQSQLAQRAR